jgi:hypothetical protein
LVFFEEYIKHSLLNLGQTLHEIRYFYSHPDFDEVAPRGSVTHFLLSLSLRTKRILNDLFYTLIPPHWHHTAEDLRDIRAVPLKKWFFYGAAQWQFNESGEKRTDLNGTEDRRWDSRCNKPQT